MSWEFLLLPAGFLSSFTYEKRGGTRACGQEFLSHRLIFSSIRNTKRRWGRWTVSWKRVPEAPIFFVVFRNPNRWCFCQTVSSRQKQHQRSLDSKNYKWARRSSPSSSWIVNWQQETMMKEAANRFSHTISLSWRWPRAWLLIFSFFEKRRHDEELAEDHLWQRIRTVNGILHSHRHSPKTKKRSQGKDRIYGVLTFFTIFIICCGSWRRQ